MYIASIAVIIIGLLIGALVVIDTLRLGIGPMPTSRSVKLQLINLLPAEALGDVVELGSGWGTLTWPLARLYPDQKVVAWEGAVVPWLFLRCRYFLCGPPNLEIRYGNFFDADLSISTAGLFVCYLYPGAMEQLAHKLESPSTLRKRKLFLVTHTFRLPGKEPFRVVTCDDLYRTPIYLYEWIQ